MHNAAMSTRASASPTLVRNESLRRGLTVLRALAGAGQPVTAAELTRQTGIPGPTVARLLVTLEDETLAVRDASGGWRPGAGLSELAGADGGLAALVAGAGEVLREVAVDTGETAILSRVRLPDLAEVLVQEDADRLLGLTDWVGRPFDPRESVAGWIVAAELGEDEVAALGGDDPEVRAKWLDDVTESRERGYAVDVDGLEAGLTNVAVIVPGGLSLAIGLSGPSARLTARRTARLVPRLRKAAASLAMFT